MAIYMWREYEPPELCFTANTANSTVKLHKQGSPNTVNLETSTDGITWTDYAFDTDITLSSVGDKVYFRNKSGTQTGFSLTTTAYYKFVMSGGIDASGNVNYLLCKNGVTDINSGSANCFFDLFYNCTVLRTAPELPSTVVPARCYGNMFYGCTNLETIPSLPALTLANYCYDSMFYGCSKIKISATQTGEYQNAYRIPTTGTGTVGTNSFSNMFTYTGGTFTSNPTINTTYYTSNQVI